MKNQEKNQMSFSKSTNENEEHKEQVEEIC